MQIHLIISHKNYSLGINDFSQVGIIKQKIDIKNKKIKILFNIMINNQKDKIK